MMKHFFLLVLLSFTFLSCNAQYNYGTPPKEKRTYTSKNKKAIKDFEKGEASYRYINPTNGSRNFESAEFYLLKAYYRDTNFVEAVQLLDEMYSVWGDFEKAIEYKQKYIRMYNRHSPNEYFYLASMQIAIGRYSDCLKSSDRFLQTSNKNTNEFFIEETKKYIRNCHFALDAMKKPVPFNPVNLGPGVNTDRPEYFPSLTADDQTLLFTRLVKDPNAVMAGIQEDLFSSKWEEGHWSKGLGISKNINSKYNEGAPTFSADGKYIIFVGCETGVKGDYDYGVGRNGYGSCDLFVSEKIGNEWTEPINLGPPINTHNWESQPCFSSDGKTLYFIRGIIKPRSKRDPQDQDIYYSEILDNGQWSVPKKLSDKINTKGREESVFIHPDGQTLYFSSDGHTGMGGLDIFMSRLDEQGEWGTPVNLGYPINTFNDENSLVVSSSGDLALFASDREGGYGSLDLYEFKLPKHLQPIKATFVKGRVYDEETGEPLAAWFKLYDLNTSKLVKQAVANSGNGEFLVAMPVNKDFALNAEYPGYLFFSKNYSIEKIGDGESYVIEVPMKKIQVGKRWVLENVFFDVDRYDLKPESILELDKLYAFLVENPKLKIELGGHTDSDGDDNHNLKLSDNRAKAVADYVIAKGIDKKRVSYKGYGEAVPVAPNDSKQNKAKNRRTEVLIIGEMD
ncbi:MAG: OmpA family protein [Flavobacteriales bacterium]